MCMNFVSMAATLQWVEEVKQRQAVICSDPASVLITQEVRSPLGPCGGAVASVLWDWAGWKWFWCQSMFGWNGMRRLQRHWRERDINVRVCSQIISYQAKHDSRVLQRVGKRKERGSFLVLIQNGEELALFFREREREGIHMFRWCLGTLDLHGTWQANMTIDWFFKRSS